MGNSGSLENKVITQRRVSWDLSIEDVSSAMEQMNADDLTKKEMNNDLRVFLYAKGVLKAENSVVRKSKFNDLLHPQQAMVSEEQRRELMAARERLHRIVAKGESGKNFDQTKNLFDEFVSQHPEWGLVDSFVIFRDHELLKVKPHAYVERIQRSGLCYMHAPVILQHYLVAMNSKADVHMLDMAVYLKKHMSGDALERRIWQDQGGDSKVFLGCILMQKPRPRFYSLFPDRDLVPLLFSHGPALVSGFNVDNAFNSDSFQHIGEYEIESTGLHAMVLVGYRKEGDQTRYLLQNWWKKKPFVEVDADYLTSCGAIVHFVLTKQTNMGQFPTNSFDHVECEMLDVQETFAPEKTSLNQ